MKKQIKISSDHSNFNKNFISIELQGGSPWFGHIWIDDVCYTVVKTAKKYNIRKTKYIM